jgi:histidinol phosphatase-like PHP family hydrolase
MFVSHSEDLNLTHTRNFSHSSQIPHSTVTNAYTAGHQAIQAQEHIPGSNNDTQILTLSLASPDDELIHPSY